MHILLVEPDKLQAATYSEVLRRAGHTIDHAVSAQQAVHLADERAPDAVVLELQLPGHNGIEFLYEFRSYHEWLAIPIVLHTFVPLHELAHASTLHRELGVKHTLYKPSTSLDRLCKVLQAVAPAQISENR